MGGLWSALFTHIDGVFEDNIEETENKAEETVSWDEWKAQLTVASEGTSKANGNLLFNRATPLSQEHIYSGPQKTENGESMVQLALS